MSDFVLEAPATRPLYPTTRLLKGAVVEAEELRRQAETTLENARTRAAETIAAATDEARNLRLAAEEEITAQRERSRAEAAREAAEDVARLLERMEEEHERVVLAAREAVLDGALKLARAILRAELSCNRERLAVLVEEALFSGAHEHRPRLHMNPEDIAFLGDRIAHLLRDHDRIALVPDDELDRFDVRLVTASAIHDSSLETRIADLEARVRGRIQEEVGS